MSGDWIKMRANLGNDPAVIAIAAAVHINEDEAVGKLHRLWSWADQHTPDGYAPGVGSTWIDRFVGRKGFSGAMQAVGWLEIEPGGAHFPHFDRHNGASAKARALNTARVQTSRICNGDSVTKNERMSRSDSDKSATREREEKRREDQKQRQELGALGAPSPPKAPPGSTLLPADWELPHDWGQWAKGERPEWDERMVLRVSLKFRDHWLGTGAARANWLATWRAWVRNEHAMAGKTPSLAERRANNIAELTGRNHGRVIDSGTVDGAAVRQAIGDLRQPNGDDVGGLPEGGHHGRLA